MNNIVLHYDVFYASSHTHICVKRKPLFRLKIPHFSRLKTLACVSTVLTLYVPVMLFNNQWSLRVSLNCFGFVSKYSVAIGKANYSNNHNIIPQNFLKIQNMQSSKFTMKSKCWKHILLEKCNIIKFSLKNYIFIFFKF